MKKWLWLALIPSLVFADSSSSKNETQDPTPSEKPSEYICEIVVRADSITILPDNTTVTRDELESPGDAFHRILDNCVSNQVCPAIKWHTEPGGEELKTTLSGQAFIIGIRMGCKLKIQKAIREMNELDVPPASKSFTPPTFKTMRQNPIYVDVEANQLTLVEEKKVITARDLMLEGNAFEQFLDEMETKKDTQYIVLLLRPGSAVFQRRLRKVIRDRGIDVRFEPWDAGRDRVLPVPTPSYEPSRIGFSPKPAPPAPNTRPCTMRQDPVYVDVHSNNVIICSESNEIAASELSVPGNDFEKLLQETELKRNLRYPVLILRPGSEKLQKRLLGIIREYDVDLGIEPWETGRPISHEEFIRNWEESIGVGAGGMSDEELGPMLEMPSLLLTPLEAQTKGKKPVFFECRNNQLFSISKERLKAACDKKIEELREAVEGDETEFLKSVATAVMEVDGYRVDFTYALLGKYLLTAKQETEGYSFDSPSDESDEMWFGLQLAELDPETQYIHFKVRPDSFNIFRKARQLTWYKYLESSCELLGNDESIRIGSSGRRLIHQ